LPKASLIIKLPPLTVKDGVDIVVVELKVGADIVPVELMEGDDIDPVTLRLPLPVS